MAWQGYPRTRSGYKKRSFKKYSKSSRFSKPYKRTYKKKTTTKRATKKSFARKRFARAVKKVLYNDIAVRDVYSVTDGERWNAAVNTQMFGINLSAQIVMTQCIANPQYLKDVRTWLNGFFTNGTHKFRVTDESYELRVKPNTNIPFELDIYFWKCRRDLPVTADWTTLNSFYTWGLTKTGNNVTMTQPGVSPFINPLWCKYFHCIKSKKIRTADPLKEYRFTMRGKYNYDFLMDGGEGQEFLAYRGRTIIMMPVIRGSPMHDSSTSAVNYAECAADVIWTNRFKTAIIENSFHDTKHVNVLTSVTPANAITTVYGSGFATYSQPTKG